MTKKILDKNYILSKYDIIKTNKHRLPVSLDFTKAENDFIRTNFQSIEKLYVYFGDQPTHGNVWIPDDIYITEIQQLAQELGVPVASIYLYWNKVEDYRKELGIPSRAEWEWQVRSACLEDATIKLINASDNCPITIKSLVNQSRLKRWEIARIIKQYGGLNKYITAISNK